MLLRASGLPLRLSLPLLTALTALAPAVAVSGKADVVAAEIRCRPAPGGRPESICHVTATVRHADAGWGHYANRFEVLDAEGNEIGVRVLRHPHVDEQPFRRSLGRVRIAHTTKHVTVRAGDLVHGLGGAEQTVEVPHQNPGAQPGAQPEAKSDAQSTSRPDEPAK